MIESHFSQFVLRATDSFHSLAFHMIMIIAKQTKTIPENKMINFAKQIICFQWHPSPIRVLSRYKDIRIMERFTWNKISLVD